MLAIVGLEQHTPSPPLPLPTRFGRYRLTKLLAVGGMAQIYLAKSFGAEGFVKPLVIKRLDPRLVDNPHFTNLFINEAKLLVALNHGNIVPVFDFGRIGRDLFMAMEYIRGASLRNTLSALQAAGRSLDVQLAAYIATEICKGLDYAHRKSDELGRPAGIIHRDIKPTNVLISYEGEVKIVDFGVAKLASRIERGGMLTGTLAYMSPEQAERQAVDPRTDIFSTGLVLYELVSGRRAYDCEIPLDMLALARQADLPPLPEQVPRELREIIARSTKRDPTDRYSSAHEMEKALSEYLLLARSVGTVMDSVSPASKLSALMKSLPLESEIEEPPAEPGETIQLDEAEMEEVSGLLEFTDPPDLGMIRAAAETFHSEFMTRVLMEEARGPSRRWLYVLGAVAGVAAVGFVVVLVIALQGWRGSAGPTRGRAASASAPDLRGPRAPDARLAQADRGQIVDAGLPDAPLEPAAPRHPRGPRYGFLNLNSIPWSNVTIDGQRLSRPTPLLHLRLRAGRHTIVLENAERKLQKVLKVKIRAGTTTWKVVHLK